VVEGGQTSAAAKMKLFDEYFGIGPFDPGKRIRKSAKATESLARGIRISTLHHLPEAAALVRDTLGVQRDFQPIGRFRLTP